MNAMLLAKKEGLVLDNILKDNPHVTEIERSLMVASLEDGFVRGYNSACEWENMSTAPKDGTHILLAHEWGDVGIGYWHKMGPYDCDTEEWCIQDSFDSGCESLTIFVDPVAWMPLPKYTHTEK